MNKLTWDYSGTKDRPELQNNWNDTLVTKLNQASAIVHNAALRHSADTIVTNQSLRPLLKTLTFFNETENGDSIGGRFKIQYSDDVNERQLIVKYDHTKDVHDGFCIIPENDGKHISVKLIKIYEDIEKYNTYVDNLSVVIDIENLSDDELYNLKNN